MPDASGLGERLCFGSPGPGDPDVLSGLLGTSAFKKYIWAWQFGRSPDRATPVTAYADGELVGFNGLMAVEAQVDGQSIPAAWSCDFIVTPACRRHGVGRAIKQELDRRCGFLMTLGTSEAAAKVLAASGWEQGEGPRSHVRVNRALGNRERIRSWIQWLLLRGGSTPADWGRIQDRRGGQTSRRSRTRSALGRDRAGLCPLRGSRCRLSALALCRPSARGLPVHNVSTKREA
jgi:GNAT superfamily N-acetyltransferase